jgi:putative hydrolase of the HAD superfamily
MPDIGLITFDLDNTLWDVDRVVRAAERRMRDWLAPRVPEFALRFPPEALFALRGQVLAEAPELRHDLSRLRERLLFEAISRCGHPHAAATELASDAFAVFYAARHDVEYFPHALDVLATLAAEYPLAALTNGNASFTRLSLDRFFRFGFNAAEVGASKPAPAMFEAALRTAGVSAERCIHIGDHPVDDIAGATAVGMHTIWVNWHAAALPTDAPRPSREVADLAAIPDAVRAISAAPRAPR